ncbi:MAG: cytochrome c [Candidatus Tectomicrobia bacterium]|nr:cytochrome c [Candidatus Tectomicrobia bacterium]
MHTDQRHAATHLLRHCRAIACIAFGLTLLAGCRQDMHEQPSYEPLEPSNFFADGRSSRPLVEGTVARGYLRLDELLYTGKINGELSGVLPFAVTRELLGRGQERYNIYCTPCHDHVGNGQGMIVQRGLRPPPSFHIDRLRVAPVGHFFDVITNGYGAMANYAVEVAPADRWAIAAYIRALQLSQHAAVAELPEADRRHLQGPNP